ncbi:MAG: hypothetical protein U0694_06695 [Anaerolineae bacterium]
MAAAVLDQRETLSGSDEMQVWWKDTLRKSEHFFNILSLFDVHSVTGEYLMTLQLVQGRIEKARYPSIASYSRHYLLAAISSVTAGVYAAMGGNAEKAHQHMDAAAISLCALERELARLGVMQ